MSTQATGRPVITADHERALRAELDRLRKELETEFAARLREARLFGSADANDDYLQIKEEEAVLSAGIANVAMLLETALVVDSDQVDAGVVTLGSVVAVRDVDTDERRELRLIGGHEPLAHGVASAGSPVGRALMGRHPGDVIEVELPSGKTRRLEIVEVDPARA